MSTYRRNEYAAQALAQRSMLGVGDGGPVDVLRLVEIEAEVNVILVDAPGGPAGIFTHAGQIPFIMMNTSLPLVRQRFTLAHEFGHFVLRHEPVVDVTMNYHPSDPREIQANQFAAEFLMPRTGIEAWIASNGIERINLDVLVRLASFYGVSCHAALFRLQDARRVSAELASQLLGILEAGEHKTLARSLQLPDYADSLAMAAVQHRGVRVPRALRRNVLDAFGAGLIGVESSARVLRVTDDEFRALAAEAGVLPPSEDELAGGLHV